MKVSIDLTEDKDFNNGISIYIKNLFAHCSQHEYCGGAFAGIEYSKKELEKQLNDFYNLKKIKIKKCLATDKILHRIKFFNVRFKYKQIFDDDTDIFLYFNNFMPINKLKCKKVVVVHDLTPLYLKTTNNFKRKKLLKSYNYTIKEADKIITVSEFSKNDIINKFPQAKGKIEVVNCGVNYERFQKRVSKDKIEFIKTKYNLPKQYILFVGQARENKNLVRLLKAYSMLPVEIKKQYGLVYSHTNDELNAMAKSLNESNLCLLSGIDAEDLVGIYQGASLFTLVSTNEGFGIPVIEAMASGVPVVCSNISSLPEVAGDAAITVDPYDETAISQAIFQILSNDELKNNLIEKGLQQIKLFSWEKSAEKFERILCNIVEN